MLYQEKIWQPCSKPKLFVRIDADWIESSKTLALVEYFTSKLRLRRTGSVFFANQTYFRKAETAKNQIKNAAVEQGNKRTTGRML
jgi:hypothetical protein